MAEKGKPFSDGEFIKKLFDNIHRICMPREKAFGEANQPFPLVSRRTNDLSDSSKETLKERLKSCEAIGLALDESTDISGTAQLVIFIKAVTAGFDIVKEF